MNERALRPGNVAAAALLIGGILMVAVPQHALSILQLVIVTIGVAGSVHALAVHVPTSGWISPFKWLSPFSDVGHLRRAQRRRGSLDHIGARFSARRQRLRHGPPIPPAVIRQLKPIIAASLDVDARNPAQLAAAERRVSPLTYEVLTSDPLERPTWLRTVRPDRHMVAEVVHRILDDLKLPTSGHGQNDSSVDPRHSSAT